MAVEDKARDRVESRDSGRERNAGFDRQGRPQPRWTFSTGCYGPGYRVYFGRAGTRLVLLLCGGTKRTQSRDIEQARSNWRDYRRRSS